MKLENTVIITKGVCLCYIPTATAIGAGLPELGVSTLFGLPVKFWTLLMAATVAGAGGLLGFLSTSFGSFLSTRNGNGGAASPPDQPKQQ